MYSINAFYAKHISQFWANIVIVAVVLVVIVVAVVIYLSGHKKIISVVTRCVVTSYK